MKLWKNDSKTGKMKPRDLSISDFGERRDEGGKEDKKSWKWENDKVSRKHGVCPEVICTILVSVK